MRHAISGPFRLLAVPLVVALAACSGSDAGGDDGPTEPPADPDLQIVTSTLSAAVVATPYSRTLGATGGDGSYQWSVQGGSLPPGLTLQASGALTGTPTEAGDFGFTVRVASGGQTATRAFDLAVTWPSVVVTTSTLPSGSLGGVYEEHLVAIGGDGTYAWSVASGALPAGLTLAGDGVIAGTPTALETASFTVEVASAGDTATRALTIDVGAPELVIQTTSLSNGSVGDAYTAALVATGGDGTYTWSLESGSLPDGIGLASDGTIAGTPTTVGSHDFVARVSSAELSTTQALTIGIAASSDATPPTISGSTPSVLIEGQTAVIEGSGFDPIPAQNQVTIGGRSVAISAASETSLTVTVPNFDCLPPRAEPLRVIVGGLASDGEVEVSPYEAGGADLAAGFYTWTMAGDGCIQLPQDAAGGEFLIGVTSVSEVPSSVTPIRLRATPGDATVLATAPVRATSSGSAPEIEGRGVGRLADAPLASPTLGLRMAEVSGHLDPVGDVAGGAAGDPAGDAGSLSRRTADEAAGHTEIMEAGLRLIESLGPPAHPARPSGSAGALGGPEAVPAAGDTLTIFADEGVSCTNRPTVQAVVRHVGANAVWLEDTASPDGTFTSQEFAELDTFYSDNVQTVHDDYFGTSSDVDGNHRVLVLMTPAVNQRGVLGYVWGGDFFPQSQCPTGNAAEIFYGIVPDSAGAVGNARTKQQVLDLYPELMTHEITHIVQLSERIFGTAGSKTVWETEGGATFAEQIVAYPLFGHAAGQELGYEAWNTGRDWYIEWTNGLVFFYGFQGSESPKIQGAPEQCTWLGNESQGNAGPCIGKTRAPYDVPSFFLRAILDRFGPGYPGGEAALMKRLTLSPFRGWEAIGDVTGRAIEEDLAEFYMTLWGDGLIGDLPMMTTWDLFDIFSHFVGQARLQPDVSSSADVQTTAAVRGASNYYLHWTPGGSLAPTSVRVTSQTGSDTPPTVSVWVLRIR